MATMATMATVSSSTTNRATVALPQSATPAPSIALSTIATATATATASPVVTPAAAIPITSAVGTPRPATLINLIGSVVLNVLGAVLTFVEGPPVLSRGSTVTEKTATLQLPCSGSVCTVSADWYFPAGSDPQGLIYLQHGILANAPMYSYTAALLAEQTDSIVVAPTITSNFFAPDALWLGGAPMQQAVADLFVGNRAALTASASAAAGHPITLPQRVVLVGHSLGGSLAVAVAADMVANGSSSNLAGVVMLDGGTIDPAQMSAALADIPADIPIRLIASPPYFWNSYGGMSTLLDAARPTQFNGVELVGGQHIDGLQGGNPLIQLGEYLVAGFSLPQNIHAVQTLSSGWITDMLNGTHIGISAAPGQTIQIPTSAGTADAIALPAPSKPLSPIELVLRAINTFLEAHLYSVEPTSGFALL
jgi:pimeloyl-ACP methyl ester carboxylesterase